MPNNTNTSLLYNNLHTHNHNENDNMTPTMLTPPIISMLEIEDALGMFTHAPKETRIPNNGKFE